MIDYDFDQTVDTSLPAPTVSEDALTARERRWLEDMCRTVRTNQLQGRSTPSNAFPGIPHAARMRLDPLVRARMNRIVFRQDDLDTALREDLAAGGANEARIADIALEAATSLVPSDAAILRRVAEIGIAPEEAVAHLGFVKAGLARHIAAEGARRG